MGFTAFNPTYGLVRSPSIVDGAAKRWWAWDLYGISIAFTIRSVDHSLSTRLIPPYSNIRNDDASAGGNRRVCRNADLRSLQCHPDSWDGTGVVPYKYALRASVGFWLIFDTGCSRMSCQTNQIFSLPNPSRPTDAGGACREPVVPQ